MLSQKKHFSDFFWLFVEFAFDFWFGTFTTTDSIRLSEVSLESRSFTTTDFTPGSSDVDSLACISGALPRMSTRDQILLAEYSMCCVFSISMRVVLCRPAPPASEKFCRSKLTGFSLVSLLSTIAVPYFLGHKDSWCCLEQYLHSWRQCSWLCFDFGFSSLLHKFKRFACLARLQQSGKTSQSSSQCPPEQNAHLKTSTSCRSARQGWVHESIALRLITPCWAFCKRSCIAARSLASFSRSIVHIFGFSFTTIAFTATELKLPKRGSGHPKNERPSWDLHGLDFRTSFIVPAFDHRSGSAHQTGRSFGASTGNSLFRFELQIDRQYGFSDRLGELCQRLPEHGCVLQSVWVLDRKRLSLWEDEHALGRLFAHLFDARREFLRQGLRLLEWRNVEEHLLFDRILDVLRLLFDRLFLL